MSHDTPLSALLEDKRVRKTHCLQFALGKLVTFSVKFGCRNRVYRGKAESFYRITKVLHHRCQEDCELSGIIRNSWIAAINPFDITERSILLISVSSGHLVLDKFSPILRFSMFCRIIGSYFTTNFLIHLHSAIIGSAIVFRRSGVGTNCKNLIIK